MRRLGRSVCLAALGLALAVLAPSVLHAQTELHTDVREAVIRVPASATDAFGKVTSGELAARTIPKDSTGYDNPRYDTAGTVASRIASPSICQRRSGLACKLYAVNNDVVWVP